MTMADGEILAAIIKEIIPYLSLISSGVWIGLKFQNGSWKWVTGNYDYKGLHKEYTLFTIWL